MAKWVIRTLILLAGVLALSQVILDKEVKLSDKLFAKSSPGG